MPAKTKFNPCRAWIPKNPVFPEPEQNNDPHIRTISATLHRSRDDIKSFASSGFARGVGLQFGTKSEVGEDTIFRPLFGNLRKRFSSKPSISRCSNIVNISRNVTAGIAGVPIPRIAPVENRSKYLPAKPGGGFIELAPQSRGARSFSVFWKYSAARKLIKPGWG